MKNKLLLFTLSLFFISLSGCKNEGAFTDMPNNNGNKDINDIIIANTYPPTNAKLYDIDIAPANGMVLSEPLNVIPKADFKLRAIGKYDSGVSYDISKFVNWEISNPTYVSLRGEGNFHGEQSGLITVTAKAPSEGIYSNPYAIAIKANFGITEICGGALNDKTENTKGQCLKVISDSKGNFFTSSPSKNYMLRHGFTEHVHGSASPSQTHAGFYSENGTSYALFHQNRFESDDESQYKKYCNYLSVIGFAGKNNWTTVSKNDFISLLQDKKVNLHSDFSWPTSQHYWTNTRENGAIVAMKLDNYSSPDIIYVNNTSSNYYASCISKYD